MNDTYIYSGKSTVRIDGIVYSMPWPTTKEDSDRILKFKEENRKKVVPAEEWANKILKQKSPLKWNRQAIYGSRIFDFWNSTFGCAIEIDGESHNERSKFDKISDMIMLHKHSVIVFRVKNFDEQELLNVVYKTRALETWKERKLQQKKLDLAKKQEDIKKLENTAIEIKEKKLVQVASHQYISLIKRRAAKFSKFVMKLPKQDRHLAISALKETLNSLERFNSI